MRKEQFCDIKGSLWHYNYRLVVKLWFLIPELGLPGGWPSWRAPRGCTRPGSGTSQRHAPARAAGRWWRWCGCACASSWADPDPCRALETCLHHSRHSSPVHSAPRHTCLRTSRYLWIRSFEYFVIFKTICYKYELKYRRKIKTERWVEMKTVVPTFQ